MRTGAAGGYLRRGGGSGGRAPGSDSEDPRSQLGSLALSTLLLLLLLRRAALGTMAAVAAASAELLIIGWYIFRVLLQVFLECCIYWVGFAFRNAPGTRPLARSEVFRHSLEKLAYLASRTGRQVLGPRRYRIRH